MRYVTVIAIVITVLFTVLSAPSNMSYGCSPWKGQCKTSEDCCRYLECLTYAAKCVPQSGTIVPGEDTRPIGDGPFPPDYPIV